MLGFPLGILSAAGAGGVAGDYELISTTTLGTAQADVTFSGLGTYSSTYKHLQIRTAARNTRTGFSTGVISLRFNGDTTSSYTYHELFGNGSSVSSYADGSQTSIRSAFFVAPDTAAANAFGGGVLDILDPFSTTKNTTTRSLSGFATPAIALTSGAFFKTDSITSITLLGIGGTDLVAGSRFSIYGLRG
jgi:hypothetical protein